MRDARDRVRALVSGRGQGAKKTIERVAARIRERQGRLGRVDLRQRHVAGFGAGEFGFGAANRRRIRLGELALEAGSCVVKDDCQGPNCFVCQSQH